MKLSSIGSLIIVLIAASVTSCKKVISVDLNAASPRYVVEANITDQPGPYLVKITRTVNFDADNIYPAVSGAVVRITDNTTGQIDTLKETSPGNYNTTALTGTPGHKYQLYINASNNIFNATSAMPLAVTLDSLYTQPSTFGRSISLVPSYTDPATKGNYYHFTEYINDTISKNVFIRNDNLINGQVMKQTLGNGLRPGDFVVLSLECVDSVTYQYYYTLRLTENQNAATPANPQTNLSGGALGYFSAHTSSTKSVRVP